MHRMAIARHPVPDSPQTDLLIQTNLMFQSKLERAI
jgi:hypothetical protein